MKKIIESELISIAHRILKLNGKSDVTVLYNETQKLYEKLSVLKFYEDNKFRLDPSLTEERLENLLSRKEEESVFVAENPVSKHPQKQAHEDSQYMSNDIINALLDDANSDKEASFEEEIEEPVVYADEMPFEAANAQKIATDFENEVVEEPVIKTVEEPFNTVVAAEPSEVQPMEIEMDAVFNISFDQIEFENKADIQETYEPEQKEKPAYENQHLMTNTSANEVKDDTPFHQVPVNKTINDAFSKIVTIGLNDRIAFEKQLFNGSSEDLNRVLSQLNTIETYQEAQDFIEDLVKPDFNNWHGKEEYESRFMQLIEKRFL